MNDEIEVWITYMGVHLAEDNTMEEADMHTDVMHAFVVPNDDTDLEELVYLWEGSKEISDYDYPIRLV
jgi:hypothetical protein